MRGTGGERQIRIGVVGLGLIAQVAHLPALVRERHRVTVSHVCDVAPGLADRIAATLPGPPVATTAWRDLLGQDRPDAVVICTPGSHARIAEAFLRAGVAVLAEKPLCLTVAEARHLGDLASQHGTVCEVAYMKTHDPVVAAAAATYRQLRDPRLIRVTVLHPGDAEQTGHLVIDRGGPLGSAGIEEIADAERYEQERNAEAVGNDPDVQRIYQDVLNGSVVHELSLLRTVVGALPEWDVCSARPLSLTEPPCIQAFGRLGDRTDVLLSWNWLPTFPDYEEELAVLADDGRMSLWMEPPYTRRRTHLVVESNHPTRAALRSRHRMVGGYESSFDQQMSNFVDQLGGAPGRNGPDEAAEDIENLQRLAAAIAASSGRVVGGEAAVAKARP